MKYEEMEVGQAVRLSAGGAAMTIISFPESENKMDELVECAWSEFNDISTGVFRANQLVLAKP